MTRNVKIKKIQSRVANAERELNASPEEKKDLLLNVRERHEGDTYRVAGCNAELISKTRERE